MTVDEAARHRLFNKLEEVLGDEEARTLMSSLPIYDLDDIVTKRDIDDLRSSTKHDMEMLQSEVEKSKLEVIASLRQEMHSLITSQTRTLMFTLIGVVLSITSLAFFR